VEWLNLTAGEGLLGLALASFLSATLLPGGSEALLWAFLQLHPDELQRALLVCTAANTAGGMVSWGCGRFLPKWRRLHDLPQLPRVRRWGSPILLLSWLPLIGDALCLAAGWLRLHWLPCCLFMAIGKGLRYAAIVATA